MSQTNESTCYWVQMQFDAFIDGDLGESQQQRLLSHISACPECGREFRYARAVQDGLLDLPLLDCRETVIAKVQHATTHARHAREAADPWLSRLTAWLTATPLAVRYAVPIVAVMAIGLLALPGLQPGTVEPPLALQQPAPSTGLPVQYSPAEIEQALEELNLAIDYLNQVSQRTEAMVGGRFLVQPLRDRLNASFERVRTNTDGNLPGNPI